VESVNNKPEWFRQWFNNTYQFLYAHRHKGEAEQQIRALLDLNVVNPGAVILDIACGAGRHMIQFESAGFRVFGFDLSRLMVLDSRSDSLPVARADMRFPPFLDNNFDLVTCFFSSFGYFNSEQEDFNTLRGFSRLLKGHGYLFLDLLNKAYLLGHFIPEDQKTIEGINIRQKRKLEGNVVIKDIIVSRNGDPPKKFQERLRVYTLEELQKICGTLSLDIVHIFGSEKGGPYRKKDSPRMALLLQKN
jgi:SAM-dependent methyltransferase